ncbi:MAG: 50S ribosomal protein L15 [Bdellovibrionales bacterium CG10_big_fil_rev_8_21_14_0_10_45_34]|nr:MAG: 50S ribosomal protein L15 [Bdellovibrionales bacterium CG10_big_fil_rev_8_21_14_0_10_45_34]
MSLLSELKPNAGSRGREKRRGRGDGSGLGGTSGRGHKGQKARSGGKVRRGFEGGQMPLYRRLPKFGFKNIFRQAYDIINLDQLNQFDGKVELVDFTQKGLVQASSRVKILGRGEVTKKLEVRAHAFSDSAKQKIEAAGGKIEVI